MSGRFRIAIYMRLSKGDHTARDFPLGDKIAYEEIGCESAGYEGTSREESNSIRMQRRLLREFVATHFKDYELLEFEDDGYSGTSFNRPGVSRLLEMVRNMEIDCIIVKDFSRFSRDYIDLGAYMEQIFPFMGVRFISVNDGYDSADKRFAAGELDISFKNLLYDLYSKDLSVKVKSALSVRKERGQYISANSPFGYIKSGEDRHMLLIEEGEAEVVRRIFALAMQGCSSADIARLFNREGVKTPMQFRVEKGETGRRPKKGIFIWQASTVCQILRNQVYVGDIVYGKTEKATVGGKNRLKPRGEWKIYTNHHAPIIDRCTFQILQEKQGISKNKPGKAQDSLNEKNVPYPSDGRQAQHPLIGKLVCGCCGRNLCFRKLTEPCFVCPYRYVDFREKCVGKANVPELEHYVLSEMQSHVLQMEGEENLKIRCREIAGKKREKWQKKRQQLQREETLLKKHRVEIYETYSADRKDSDGGKESNGNQAVNGDFLERENLLRTKLAEIEKKKMTIMVKNKEAEEKMTYWGQIVDREPETAGMMSCLGLTELTRRNVSELIDKIVVYGGENVKKEKNVVTKKESETEKDKIGKDETGKNKTGKNETEKDETEKDKIEKKEREENAKESGMQKYEIHWMEWERVKLFQHLCDTGGD